MEVALSSPGADSAYSGAGPCLRTPYGIVSRMQPRRFSGLSQRRGVRPSRQHPPWDQKSDQKPRTNAPELQQCRSRRAQRAVAWRRRLNSRSVALSFQM